MLLSPTVPVGLPIPPLGSFCSPFPLLRRDSLKRRSGLAGLYTFHRPLECLHNIVPKVSLATGGNIYCPFAEDLASFVEAKRAWPPACVPGARVRRIAELGETKPMPGPFKWSAALSFPTRPFPFVLSCPEAGNNPRLPNLSGFGPV